MAWIESHQELERHPKTLKLMSLTGGTLDDTLGKLHRFWWWCLAYAEDGDLRKYDLKIISSYLNIDSEKLVEAGWIDITPYLRVHDWLKYVHRFLYSKYKNYTEKIRRIERMYKDSHKGSPKGLPKGLPNPILPNLTKPNLTKPKDNTKAFIKPTPEEVSFYASEINFNLEGQKFCDYYESKGWFVGRSPMKNWKACVRTWKSNSYGGNNGKSKDVGYATAKPGKYPD